MEVLASHLWRALNDFDNIDLRDGPSKIEDRRVFMRDMRKGLYSIISERTIHPKLDMDLEDYHTNGDIKYVENLSHHEL